MSEGFAAKLEKAVRLWGVDTRARFVPARPEDGLGVFDEVHFSTPEGEDYPTVVVFDGVQATVSRPVFDERGEIAGLRQAAFRRADTPGLAMALSRQFRDHPPQAPEPREDPSDEAGPPAPR